VFKKQNRNWDFHKSHFRNILETQGVLHVAFTDYNTHFRNILIVGSVRKYSPEDRKLLKTTNIILKTHRN